jgi:DNA polymerase III, alpha subunit
MIRAALIEGMIRNTGKHACGVIIADQDITNLIPVTLQEATSPHSIRKPLGRPRPAQDGLPRAQTLTVISDAQATCGPPATCRIRCRAVRSTTALDCSSVDTGVQLESRMQSLPRSG